MVFNVLNKLKWKGCLGKIEIIIKHRGSQGDRKVISGRSITEVKKSYFMYKIGDNETFIPLHRVLEVRMGKKVLWKRKA